MKALKTFIRPLEAPQGNVKIKFMLIFILIQLSEMHGAGRVEGLMSMSTFSFHGINTESLTDNGPLD